MQLKIDWLDIDPSEVKSPEDALLAELRICIGESNITQHTEHRSQKAFDTVLGEMAGLAEWIVDNWCFVFHEVTRSFPNEFSDSSLHFGRQECLPHETMAQGLFEQDDKSKYFEVARWLSRHRFGAKRSNVALPCIVLSPEDDCVLVQVTGLPSKMRSSVLFTSALTNVQPSIVCMSKTDIENELKKFVEAALDRARNFPSIEKWVTWMQGKWETSRQKAENPENVLEIELGAAGAKFVRELGKKDKHDAKILRTLLYDCKRLSSENELGELAGVLVSSEVSKDAHRPAWSQAKVHVEGTTWHERGYGLAQQLRDFVRAKSGPIVELDRIMTNLGINRLGDVSTDLLASGVFLKPNENAFLFCGNKGGVSENLPRARFAMAASIGRLIYEHVISGGQCFGAGHGNHTQLSKYAIANSFAVEFLLPRIDLLKKFDPKHPKDSAWSIAVEYGITPKTVGLHAFNAGLIEQKKLRAI